MGIIKSRRTYNSEFKREASRLVLENNKAVSTVAENLGIRKDLLHKWIKEKINRTPSPIKGN